MNIVAEIGIEIGTAAIVGLALSYIAYRAVRLEERPIADPNAPRSKTRLTRKDDEMARELLEEYAEHNRTARYESGTYISLPSVTFTGVISGIASFLMTMMVGLFHISGIAQLGIHGLVSQEVLDDAYIGTALFVMPLIMMVIGLGFYKLMTTVEKMHARMYAETRVRKNRLVYISQRYSMDERSARRKIRNADKRAAKRAQERAAERRVATRSSHANGNIVEIGKSNYKVV